MEGRRAYCLRVCTSSHTTADYQAESQVMFHGGGSQPPEEFPQTQPLGPGTSAEAYDGISDLVPGCNPSISG